MKKVLLVSSVFLFSTFLYAKKVKFAVDMTGITINTTGMHITGDFQTLAGFSGDWLCDNTPLTQETDTNIYSIVVDIPAFAKYEYKFINGDQCYEVEFVPVESRVGYNFDDNRWLYVDSLADDTTFVGAILFGGNAPAGLTLIRFLVDMQNEPSVSANGVHIAGDFQGWNPATTRLYSFGADVYEIISYVTAGTYQYKYYNGNISGTDEIVPALCAVSNNRQIAVTTDVVLPPVCFSDCVLCVTGINQHEPQNNFSLFPNPAHNYSMLHFSDNNLSHTIILADIAGRAIREYVNYNSTALRIEKSDLKEGVYLISITDDKNNSSIAKLIIW